MSPEKFEELKKTGDAAIFQPGEFKLQAEISRLRNAIWMDGDPNETDTSGYSWCKFCSRGHGMHYEECAWKMEATRRKNLNDA